jgi:hypothetical protein
MYDVLTVWRERAINVSGTAMPAVIGYQRRLLPTP